MSMLGLFDPENQQSEGRRKLAQGVLFGGGLAGASAVVLALIELVRSNPDKGFMLLEKWGPWYFLAMFCVWALNGIAMRILDVTSEVGERFAGSMDRIADEQVKLAEAARDQAESMKRSADRDDRDHERMATLVDYSGQQSREAAEQSRQTAETVSAMHDVLSRIAAQMNVSTRKDG